MLHGTAGLDRVSFQALNRSDAAIACEASIAHWYSAEIGRAAPGETVAADLWSDPASGAVYLLNAGQDRMPVQVLFCGIEGKAASTRSDILLARRAGAAEPAIDLACDGATPDGKLACSRRQDR